VVSELYEALKVAGVEDDLARRAAASVLGRTDSSLVTLARHAASSALAREEDERRVVTKRDLLEFQTRLQRFLIQGMVALTGIFAALVAILTLL
jgi:hypothetical protein